MLKLRPMPKGSFAEVIKVPSCAFGRYTSRSLTLNDLVRCCSATSRLVIPRMLCRCSPSTSSGSTRSTVRAGASSSNCLRRIEGSIEAAVERAFRPRHGCQVPRDRVPHPFASRESMLRPRRENRAISSHTSDSPRLQDICAEIHPADLTRGRPSTGAMRVIPLDQTLREITRSRRNSTNTSCRGNKC
jgi:hypothetical protein